MGYSHKALFRSLLHILPLLCIQQAASAAVTANQLEPQDNFKRDDMVLVTRDDDTSGNKKITDWFTVTDDGSEITPIGGPQGEAVGTSGNTRAKSFLEVDTTNNSYTYGFGNYHGDLTFAPGFGKFLFDCQFGLIGAVPGTTGLGPKTPYPGGQYNCAAPSVPKGTIRISQVKNNVNWNMTYVELSFILKVIHDTKAVLWNTTFFDFQFNYTPNTAKTQYAQVLNGQWEKAY